MLGLKTFINSWVLVAAVSAVPLSAGNADYFPLQVGNQWVYQTASRWFSGTSKVVSIPGMKTIDGTNYFIVEGLEPRVIYMRSDEETGVLYVHEERSGGEAQYAAFATPAGASYRTMADPCNATALVRARDVKVNVPAGAFTGAMHVEYPSANCADAGLGEDYFVPYVGLVKRTGITIAGPVAMELTYARIGGVTVLARPEVSFSMSLDRMVYDINGIPMLNARMTLRSTLPRQFPLVWPSGQRFDIVIRDERGAEVARWSDGQGFTQAFSTEKFGPGERNYTAQMALQDGRNKRLPAGKYVAEGYLATQGEQKPFLARVGFEIIPEAEPAQP